MTSEPIPKLPLPDLPATLERYLDALKAVVSEEELQRVEGQVKALLEDEVAKDKIMAVLKERGEKEENWVRIAKR